jgi:hypothetical protein
MLNPNKFPIVNDPYSTLQYDLLMMSPAMALGWCTKQGEKRSCAANNTTPIKGAAFASVAVQIRLKLHVYGVYGRIGLMAEFLVAGCGMCVCCAFPWDLVGSVDGGVTTLMFN